MRHVFLCYFVWLFLLKILRNDTSNASIPPGRRSAQFSAITDDYAFPTDHVIVA